MSGIPAEHIPLIEKLADELDEAQADAMERQPLVEPTAEEARNGWTAESLTRYLAERTAGAALGVDPHSLHRKMARRPRSQNNGYSPHRWRA